MVRKLDIKICVAVDSVSEQNAFGLVVGDKRIPSGESLYIERETAHDDPKAQYSVKTSDTELWEQICSFEQGSIGQNIRTLSGRNMLTWCNIPHEIAIDRDSYHVDYFENCSIYLYFDDEEGSASGIEDVLAYCGFLEKYTYGSFSLDFSLSSVTATIRRTHNNDEGSEYYHFREDFLPIGVYLQDLEEAFFEWHERALRDLAQKQQVKNAHTVALRFDFPDELRTPCEQYLLYFAEFLKDAGIDATADLKHDAASAKQVLFTVTPDDPETALDKIREALSIYLRLPTAPMSAMPMGGVPGLMPTTPLEVQKLVHAVQSFQAQLSFANLTMMQQASLIQSQQTIIGNYQQAAMQPFTGGILVESVQAGSGSEKSGDAEKILGGIVELGKAEKYGVAVNLGEAFRKVRGLLSKKKDGQP